MEPRLQASGGRGRNQVIEWAENSRKRHRGSNSSVSHLQNQFETCLPATQQCLHLWSSRTSAVKEISTQEERGRQGTQNEMEVENV